MKINLYTIGKKFTGENAEDNITPAFKELFLPLGIIADSICTLPNLEKLSDYFSISSSEVKVVLVDNAENDLQSTLTFLKSEFSEYSINSNENIISLKNANKIILFGFFADRKTQVIEQLKNELIKSTMRDHLYYSLHCFGLSDDELKDIFKKIKLEVGCEIYLGNKNYQYDATVIVRAKKEFKEQFEKAKRLLGVALAERVYSIDDKNMSDIISECSKVFDKKINLIIDRNICSVGHILSKNNSDCINLNIEYSNIKYLKNIFNIEVDEYPSSRLVHSLVGQLLEKNPSEIAIVVVGNFSEGSVIIGVGDSENIHIYRHDFDVDEKTFCTNSTDTALFYILSKLKKGNVIIKQVK